METVIVYLTDMAEAKASQARKKADKVALAAAAKIGDLEQEETPESLMLLTMTEDGARERTDREVVVPWLKFLWEIYRAILELLHKSPKLDKVYHKTCEKAFEFCQDYKRTLEFRRLCDMLRMHLTNVQKLTSQTNRQNKVAWEWTNEAIELYLQTRFKQLEVSTFLELWNEGFKTVEEIYSIMQLGKRMPKPRLMSIYYEKLTRIFWVSENYLFHAYAWYRYHTLCCEFRKDMKGDERTAQANIVLLSTLSIPEEGVGNSATQSIGASTSVDDDDEKPVNHKTHQMAVLLDFTAHPTRQALLTELIANGILEDVSPELRELYKHLEGSFQPLRIIKDISPVLKSIAENQNLAVYIAAIKRVSVVRAMQQLSKVYSSVRVDFVQRLISGLEMPFFEVERLIVAAVQRKQLQMRIDHNSGCIRFDSTLSAGSAVDSHLAQLGSNLKKFLTLVNTNASSATPQFSVVEPKGQSDDREEYLAYVASKLRDGSGTFGASKLSPLDRKMLIERRKEERERLQQDRLRDEDARRRAEEAKRIAEEEQRLLHEEETRKQVKLAKLQSQMAIAKTKSAMQALGKTVDDAVLAEMKDADLQKMLLEAQLEAQRAKEDENRKLADQTKRLDYMTRAIRIESAQLVKDRYKQTVDEDLEIYNERVTKIRNDSFENYQLGVQEKARLFIRMHAHVAAFENSLLGNQRSQFEKQIAQLRKKAINELRDRRIANARFRKREDDEAREMEEEAQRELAEKEENDRLMKEEHERLRREREIQLELEIERDRLEAEELKQRTADAPISEYVDESSKPAEKWRPSFQRKEADHAPPARSGWGSGGDASGSGRGGWSDRGEQPSWGGNRGGLNDRDNSRSGAEVDSGDNAWKKAGRPQDRSAGDRDGGGDVSRWGSGRPSGGRSDDRSR